MKRLIPLWILALLIATLSGCITPRTEHMPAEKCVFVEMRTLKTGRVIRKPDNVWGEMPGRSWVDFPTYRFDRTCNVLRGAFDFGPEDSFVAILGREYRQDGSVGGGGASRLYKIVKTPYVSEPLSITAVFSDGSINCAYETNIVKLRPQQSWSTLSETNVVKGEWEESITTLVTIENYGLLDYQQLIWCDPKYWKFRSKHSAQPVPTVDAVSRAASEE